MFCRVKYNSFHRHLPLINFCNKPFINSSQIFFYSKTSNAHQIYFVLGGPGSGKGTNCERLVKDFPDKFVHFSAGELLRNEIKDPTSPFAPQISQLLTEGKIVPGHITIGLLKKAILPYMNKPMNILIDGFPRKMSDREEFENQIEPCSFVLFFECNDDIIEQRLLERAKTSGRSDDNLNSIKKRLITFYEQTIPVIEYFDKLGKVKRVNAMQSKEDVYRDTKRIFFNKIL